MRSRTTRKVRERLYFVLPAVRGVMAHGNLRQAGARLLRENIDEAVHLTIKRHGLGKLAPQRAQGAAQVFRLHAGHFANKPIAQQAGNFANEKVVLPIGSETENGVIALAQLGEQERNIRRIVLQIAVHGDDDVARGPVDARLQRCRLAEVAAQADDLNERIAPRQLLELHKGTIAAAVVHENDFVLKAQRIEDSAQPLMQPGDVVPLVLDRNHHRKFHKSPRALARRRPAGRHCPLRNLAEQIHCSAYQTDRRGDGKPQNR